LNEELQKVSGDSLQGRLGETIQTTRHLRGGFKKKREKDDRKQVNIIRKGEK
jgi:hypothetical protein